MRSIINIWINIQKLAGAKNAVMIFSICTAFLFLYFFIFLLPDIRLLNRLTQAELQLKKTLAISFKQLNQADFLKNKMTALRRAAKQAGLPGRAQPKNLNCFFPGFPVSTLKLSGILFSPALQWAFVSSPDGLTEKIQAKSFIGAECAQVVKIAASQVDLVYFSAQHYFSRQLFSLRLEDG